MPRALALLDLLAGFDPDRTLARSLDVLDQSARSAKDALEVPPQLMQTLRQCLDEGATVHRKPGAIDRLVLTPEAAVMLMDHGAIPQEGWIAALLGWVEGSFHAGNALQDAVHPQTANQWLRRAIRQSITLRPDLDWLRVYKSEFSGNREILIDRLSLRDQDIVRHLRQARLDMGLPLVPNQADRLIYTQLLSDVLDEYPRHRRLWQDLGTDQVARELLDKGADPSRLWSQNAPVPRDDPFLVRALFKDPALAQMLLDKGAGVSEQAIEHLGRALVDRHRRLPISMQTRNALQAIFRHAPSSINLDEWRPEGAAGKTIAQLVEPLLPGVLDEWRCLHQAQQIDQSTVKSLSDAPCRRL